MKRMFVIAISMISLLAFGNVSAQVANQGIGISAGSNYFVGDYPDIPLSSGSFMPNLGFYTFYQVKPKLTLKFQAGYGQVKSVVNNIVFKTSMIPVEVTGLFALSKNKNFPYLKAGLGVINFKNNGATSFEGMALAGVGMNIAMSPALSLLLSGDFRYITDDKINGVAGGLNDGYFSLQSGLSFNLNKEKRAFEKKDADKSKILAAANEIEKQAQPQTVAAKQVTQDDVYLDLIRLRSQIERLEKDIQEKNKQLENLIALINDKDDKITGLQSRIASLNSAAQQTPRVAQVSQQPQRPAAPANAEANDQIKQKYDIALNNFNAGNYRAAIMELEELSTNNANHRLASNFVYWIGESYFALQDYELAVKSFEKIANFTRSTKFDYALYMAGRSYLKMGETGMAAQKFQALLDGHPNSVLANKASQLLQSLQREIIS